MNKPDWNEAEVKRLKALNAELVEALEAIEALGPGASLAKAQNIAEAVLAKARQ